MSLPKLLEAMQTLRALEAAASRGDLKADAFVPWFAGWLMQAAQPPTS